MARPTNKLSDVMLRKQGLKEGVHGDGGGLYIRVSKTGSRAFVAIYTRNGRRVELGLGAYPATSLATAREKARAIRTQLADGKDPLSEKRREAPPTLDELTDRFKKEFESTVVPKLAARWRSLITIHAASIKDYRVDHITTSDIVAVLKPVQATNPASAKHMRSTLARIFDFAKVHGFRADNPAVWESHLALVMTPLGAKTTHQPAMPHSDCPSFFRKMQDEDTTTKAALRFLMLTASRTNEVAGMRWGEVDGDVWTIPEHRTKTRVEHRVPLSRQALAIIERQRVAIGGRPAGDALVFPGRFKGRPMSPHTLLRFLAADVDGANYTVHGFRSSFRQWGSDETDYSADLLERCLGHKVGSEVQRSYDRSDYLERRRPILQDWADFLTTTSAQG